MKTKMPWKYRWTAGTRTTTEHDVGTQLGQIHVNKEDTDTCTRLAHPILAEAAKPSGVRCTTAKRLSLSFGDGVCGGGGQQTTPKNTSAQNSGSMLVA